MVEIKSEENNTVQLPNNIRQVGTPGEKIKIYIEDYVMTYLNQMTGEKPALQKAALLLGEKVKKESTDIYFISAAVAVVPMEWKEDRFKLSSDEWTALYDKINHYFKNRHILGWFLSRTGQAAAADGEIEKIHSDNFKDKGPIFYTADPLDREDAFYLYENGHLFRQHGYYIYYDRNEAMQNYMIEIRQENQGMCEGTPGFQNRLYEKKTDHHIRREAVSGKSKNRNMKWIPQAAVLVLILVAIGIRRNMPGGILPVVQNRVAQETQIETAAANNAEHFDIVESIVQQAEQSAAEKDIRDTEDADQNGVAESSEENQSEEQDDAAETTVSSTGTATAGKVYQQYTVKEGDTLLKISRNYYQDAEHVKAIIQLNQIENPDYIYPGMVLKLP